jgi:hypothetical protein
MFSGTAEATAAIRGGSEPGADVAKAATDITGGSEPGTDAAGATAAIAGGNEWGTGASGFTGLATDEITAWDANAAMGNHNFVGGGIQDGNPPTGDGCSTWKLEATGWLQSQNEGNNGQDGGHDGQDEGTMVRMKGTMIRRKRTMVIVNRVGDESWILVNDLELVKVLSKPQRKMDK